MPSSSPDHYSRKDECTCNGLPSQASASYSALPEGAARYSTPPEGEMIEIEEEQDVYVDGSREGQGYTIPCGTCLGDDCRGHKVRKMVKRLVPAPEKSCTDPLPELPDVTSLSAKEAAGAREAYVDLLLKQRRKPADFPEADRVRVRALLVDELHARDEFVSELERDLERSGIIEKFGRPDFSRYNRTTISQLAEGIQQLIDASPEAAESAIDATLGS